jgi:hypothetical protein
MSNFIFKSNSAILATSPSPAWTTGQQSGYFVPLVQGSEISVSVDRQTSKQVGSQQYALDSIVRAPNVSFNVDYLFSPHLVNEYLLGLSPASGSARSIASGMSTRDQNFYLIINDQNGQDLLQSFTGVSPRTNFSGMTCAAIGNCFLNNYSVGFQVGGLPTVSASFSASNLQMTNLTGSNVSIPAINLASGNNSGSGFLNFSNLKTSLSGYSNQFNKNELNIFRPQVVSPQNVSAQLENLQMGGAVLVSGAIIQSVNLSVPFERTDLYGLGSNHVYGRKLQLPIRASVDVSAIVDQFSSGNLHLLNRAEETYDFDIIFADQQQTASGKFEIRGAKINSFSHSMTVNNRIEFSANYSVEVTDASGLVMFPYSGQIPPEPPTYISSFDIVGAFAS